MMICLIVLFKNWWFSPRSVLWTAPGPRALRYGPSRALMGPGLPKGQWPISIATLNDGKYTALFKNGVCTGLRLSSQFKFQMASVVYTTVCPMFTPTYIGFSWIFPCRVRLAESSTFWRLICQWSAGKSPLADGQPVKLSQIPFLDRCTSSLMLHGIYTWLVDGTAMPISFLFGTDEIPMFKPGCPKWMASIGGSQFLDPYPVIQKCSETRHCSTKKTVLCNGHTTT